MGSEGSILRAHSLIPPRRFRARVKPTDASCCTAMALTGPMIVAPAMNERMYKNKLLQANIEKLRELGVEVLEPEEGWLSCGASGKGRLPSVPELVRIIKEKAGV